MNLKDLEFKAEDFDEVCGRRVENVTPYYLAKFIADEANRILAEKLDIAPLLFGNWSEDAMSFDWTVGVDHTDDTHKARLVCVEEIK